MWPCSFDEFLSAIEETKSLDRDYNRLKRIYERLIISYQDDVEKYARNETMARVIRYIIDSAFRYAGSSITFEKFGDAISFSRNGRSFQGIGKGYAVTIDLSGDEGEVADVAQVCGCLIRAWLIIRLVCRRN